MCLVLLQVDGSNAMMMWVVQLSLQSCVLTVFFLSFASCTRDVFVKTKLSMGGKNSINSYFLPHWWGAFDLGGRLPCSTYFGSWGGLVLVGALALRHHKHRARLTSSASFMQLAGTRNITLAMCTEKANLSCTPTQNEFGIRKRTVSILWGVMMFLTVRVSTFNPTLANSHPCFLHSLNKTYPDPGPCKAEWWESDMATLKHARLCTEWPAVGTHVANLNRLQHDTLQTRNCRSVVRQPSNLAHVEEPSHGL